MRNSLNEWMVAEQESLYPGVPMLRVERTSFHVWGGLDLDEEQPLGSPGVYFSQKYEETTPEFQEEFRQEYVATACRLTAIRPLYLMRPLPEMGINVPLAMGRALLLGKSREPSISLEAYHQRNAFVWGVQDQAREECGAQILDPLPYLCDEQRCYGSRDGKPLYYDDDHLSEYGNRLLLPLFKTLFD
mgnify:FL=1